MTLYLGTMDGTSYTSFKRKTVGNRTMFMLIGYVSQLACSFCQNPLGPLSRGKSYVIQSARVFKNSMHEITREWAHLRLRLLILLLRRAALPTQ